jgi:hypothetical protein
MDQESEPMNPDQEFKAPMTPLVVPDDFKHEADVVEEEETDHVGRSTYRDDTERTAKDVEGVAKEVLEGKWGVGQDRRKALADAGFDPNEVQEEVLRLVNKRP